MLANNASTKLSMSLDVLAQIGEGFLLLDKAASMTSANALAHIKRVVGKGYKIGHAGTLDLFATGLLVVGVGRTATRLLSSLMKLDKKYEVRARLGQETDTLDFTGNVIKECPIPAVKVHDLQAIFNQFVPVYEQTPPLYSALKFQGQRLSHLTQTRSMEHDLLCKVADNKKRAVQIYACDIKTVELPFFTCSAHVSHGTYIRSLIRDGAHALGSCATVHELRRTQIGPLSVEHALPVCQNIGEEVDVPLTRAQINNALISVEDMSDMLAEYMRSKKND